MTKKFICLALIVNLLCLSSVYKVYSQDPLDNDTSISTINAEKIYIQLSGTSFNTSETIWFKAIVTDALNHLPATKSGVLHVELIDPLENQIVDENLLKISGGVSHGFFQLHSRYREGKYIIRAYTEWNKNFGSDFSGRQRLAKIDPPPLRFPKRYISQIIKNVVVVGINF